MNIEQANAIPIVKILETLNHSPTRTSEKESWYRSPFRIEKTASFHAHLIKNLWFDFGDGIGGNTVKFVQAFLKSHGKDDSVSSALFWMREHIQQIDYKPVIKDNQEDQKKVTLKLKSARAISHLALIQYLESRGIPLGIAKKNLEEIRFLNRNTGKTVFALGLPNEEDGYELSNNFFKGCIGKKSISFIRGAQPKPSAINVFEGMMDYLSVITQRNGIILKNDTIILNSISCIRQIVPYITGYGYDFGYTWMDNDQSGKNATLLLKQIFKEEKTIAHCPMNQIYQPYKDVNAWHMHKLEL